MLQLQLADLTLDELKRVQETLKQRYAVGPQSSIRQIAFGMAEKNSLGDPLRGPSVCFYVADSHKRPAQELAHPIEPSVRVRLRRGSRFCELVAPTDVLLLSPSELELTGRDIGYANGESATTGILLAWKHPKRHRLAWAVLTVAHIFPRRLRLPEDRIAVAIASSGRSDDIPARLIARADHAGLDAALCIVRRQDLLQHGLITSSVRSSGRSVKNHSQLSDSMGSLGYSMPAGDRLPFQFARFLLEAPIFQPLLGYAPKHVLHVLADDAIFAKGTSGSPWSVGRLAAGMQFASLKPAYRQGFGQSLWSILNWVRQTIAKLESLSEHEVDLRFIRFFA